MLSKNVFDRPLAEAAEIKVLSAFGMQSVLEDLGPKFERDFTLDYSTEGYKP